MPSGCSSFMKRSSGASIRPTSRVNIINYGNGLRLFEIVRQIWGNDVHVLFQSGSVWGSYEEAVNRMKPQCPNISFLGKYPFLQQPLHYFQLSLPQRMQGDQPSQSSLEVTQG